MLEAFGVISSLRAFSTCTPLLGRGCGVEFMMWLSAVNRCLDSLSKGGRIVNGGRLSCFSYWGA